ncbi:hypothetical protein TKK_0018343 [Trichogramma kaykai]
MYGSRPLVSFANGLISICLKLTNYKKLQCTQFELGDKEINWFSTNIVRGDGHSNLSTGAIYNLPRGEGFLTYVNIKKVSNGYFLGEWGKYLIKIGLDGKLKQFLDPDMGCHIKGEMSFTNIFEDDQGNYCLSIVCVKPSFNGGGYGGGYGQGYGCSEWSENQTVDSSFIKLHSRCFKPEEFKNVYKIKLDEPVD